MKIYVDADAFPNSVKEILIKAVIRKNIDLIFIANQPVSIPKSDLIAFLLVKEGADIADDKIVELVIENDLVITADIPLADRVISKNGNVLTPRGQVLTEENIKQKLAMRDLMYDLRSTGENFGGPPPFTKKDAHHFANSLDKILSRIS